MNMDEKQLPPGWELATLNDLCAINPKHVAGIPDETPVSFVPMAAVSDVHGRIETPEVRPYGEVKRGFTHFADGDVIFAKITPCMENGKAASVRGLVNGLGCGTTEFFVFRSKGALSQDYLFHFIRQESYRKLARAQMQSGVGQARVPREFIEDTELPLPPLPEQRRIVAKIEALQERSGRAAKALEEVGPLLEQFRQSILAAAFSGRLTADWREKNPNVDSAQELASVNASVVMKTSEHATGLNLVTDLCPDNWAIAELGEVFTFIDYRGRNPEKAATGRRLITAKNIRMGFIQDDPVEYISEDTYREWMTRGFPEKGDLLFVTEGHTMGYVAMNERDDDFALAQRTITLHPPAGVNSQCFLYFLMSPVFQLLVKENATGSAAQGVKGARLRGFPVPFPSFAEQTEIVRRVQSLFAYLVATEAAVHYGRDALPQLNQSILAKAFRGELVPQDPNDEPASELLARIRREREGEVSGDRVQGSGRKKGAGVRVQGSGGKMAKRSKRSSKTAPSTTPDASADTSPEPARRQRRRRETARVTDPTKVIEVLAEGDGAYIHAEVNGADVSFYTRSGWSIACEIDDVPEEFTRPRESARVASLREIMSPELALLYPENVNPIYLPQLRDWYTWAVTQLPENIHQRVLDRASRRWSDALQLGKPSTGSGRSRRRNSGRLFDA